ncbi:MAG: hypothetical protein KF791_20050 [Verrucomicrobiae bacterium]|nr:hypothetical protein [Verrucomicrobiae bacterium]
MKTKTLFKLSGLATGAFLAGPIGAWIGACCGEAGFETVAILLKDRDLEIAKNVGSIFNNLLAGELGTAWAESKTPGENHHFRRALAKALVTCLSGTADTPGPVLGELLRSATYGSVSPNERQRLAQLVAKQREPFEKALKEWPKTAALERLFPPGRPDESYLPHTEDAAGKDRGPALWGEFYAHCLSGTVADAEWQSLSGGRELYHREVSRALARQFPGRLSDVMRDTDFTGSWIAFQKLCFTQTQRQLAGLGDQFTELTEGLGQLASSKDLQELSSRVFERLNGLEGRLTQIDANLATLLDAERARSGPPLFVPQPGRDALERGGLDRLHYSARWMASVGREDELACLSDFLQAPQKFLWWGVVGEGGVGKSRLALELVTDLSPRGWTAGFLERDTGWFASPALEAWQPSQPTLIVVDYSPALGRSLVDGLARLGGRSADFGPRVRILLLDRPGAVGPLFSELVAGQPVPGTRSIFSRAREHLYRHSRSAAEVAAEAALKVSEAAPIRDTDLLPLRPLPLAKQRILLGRVLSSLGKTSPLPSKDDPFWRYAERLTANGRPLLVQALGEFLSRQPAASTGMPVLNAETGDALLDDLLHFEIRERWPLYLQGTRPNAVDEELRRLELAVCYVTLTRGLPLPAGAGRLAAVAGVQVDHADTSRLLSTLKRVLHDQPGPDGTRLIRPLSPDLFAVRLLVTRTRAHPDLGHPAFNLDNWLPLAWSDSPKGCLETLDLLAQDYPEDMANWLTRLVAMQDADACPFVELLPGVSRNTVPALVCRIGALGVLEVDLPEGLLEAVRECANRSIGNRFGVAYGLAKAAGSLAERAGGGWRKSQLDPLLVMALQDPLALGFARLEARIAMDAVGAYGGAQDWVALEQWARRLEAVAAKFPEDREVQLEVARAAFNTASAYGRAQDWVALEQWARRLEAVAAKFPGDHEVQLRVANLAFNAVSDYGAAQDWVALEQWARRLEAVAAKFPEDREMQLRVAKAAFNTASAYGGAQDWVALEHWARRLEAVAAKFPEDREVQLEMARAAFNAVTFYGEAQNWVALELWAARLETVAAKFPEDREVQLVAAKAAANAAGVYGRAQDWVALEQWARRLESVVFRLARAIHDQDSVNQLSQLLAATFQLVQQFRQPALDALWRRWELDEALGGTIKALGLLHSDGQETGSAQSA